jgi:hypothetical protein
LERTAQEQGLTPADWIAASLPGRSAAGEEHSLALLLEGLIGAIDSSGEPRRGGTPTAFGDMVAKKLERQGLRRP